MLLTGTAYRPFYPQDSLNWASSFTPIEIQDECNFYLSGAQNELIYKLKNNKIYSADNELISNYNNNQIVNLSGNISDTYIDLYKEGLPLFLGRSRKTIGDLSGFVFELNNGSINLDSVSILGEQPEYFVDVNFVYTSGVSIPISISHNGSYDIIIYSGSSNNTNYTLSGVNNLVVPSGATSTIYLINNSTFIPNEQLLSIELYTNIGLETLFINISGQQIIDSDLFYITLTPPVNGIFADTNLTYSLSFANQSGSNIEVSLEYVSGVTGKYYKSVQNTGYQSSGAISGFISGAGFLTGLITGNISGFNTLSNEWESGVGTGFARIYYISDDKVVTGTYSVIGTGRGDVQFITNIKASGFAENILYSGFISYQGGFLTGITGVYGTGQLLGETYEGTLENGISTLFSPYTGTIIAIFNPDEYDSTTLRSPVRYVTGTFITGLNLLGFGYATGKQVTGFLQGDFGAYDYEPGFYKFEKPFVGPVTGNVFEYTGLNPITTEITSTTTTGLVSTNLIYNLVAQGCKIDLNFNLTGTGIPLSVRRPGDTGNVFPVNIFNTFPFNTGEWPYENLDFQTGSGTIEVFPYFPTGGRTRISRPGPTISGTGYFNNVFQAPFFSGNSSWANGFYGWKESLTYTKDTTILSGNPVSLAYVSGLFNLFEEYDSAIIDFTITGSDFDLSDNIKFYFNTNETGKILFTDFYKVLPSSKEFLFSRSGGATAYAGNQLIGNNFYQVSSLLSGTGDYQVVMSYKSFTPELKNSHIIFSNNSFTGCEKDGRFVFQIQKSGFLYYKASGTITAKFTGENYPFVSDEVLRSGITWNWNFDTLEYSKTYGFDIYKNNRYQTNWGGQLEIKVNGYTYSDPFTSLQQLEIASPVGFVILDDDKLECTGCKHSGCLSTLDPRTDIILPVQKDLGIDFKKIEETYPDSFAANPTLPIDGGGRSPRPPGDSGGGGSSSGGGGVGGLEKPPANPLPDFPKVETEEACCENVSSLKCDLKLGEIECGETRYRIKVNVCIDGLNCDNGDRTRHFLTDPDFLDLGSGGSEDICADSPATVFFNIGIGETITVKGKVKGRVWQCAVDGPALGPGESNNLKRESFEVESSKDVTNTVLCDCCANYGLEEASYTCPEGYILEDFGERSCPEGKRTCYQCVPDTSVESIGTLNNLDYLLDILLNE
jgi:hypothetical protein